MSTILRNNLLILMALALMPTLAGCSDDSGSGSAKQYCQSIVTFTGNSGGRVWFEYRELDDSPLITLSAAGNLDENNVKPGTRLLMRYTMPPTANPADGGEVDLVGLQRVMTDTVALADTPPAAIEPLSLTTINRSADYLNIYCQMSTARHRSMTISADTSTIATTGEAQLYISATTDAGATSYHTQSVASLWIGPVWNRPDINAVTVYVENSNNPYRKQFKFHK